MENFTDTLYHYCTPEAFISMLSSRKIWLSSLTLSNDSNEGKVLNDAFTRILEKNEHDIEVKKKASAIFDSFEMTMDGLGFCLSSAGDLLSQWRGYAANGQGFSIGFSKQYLTELSKNIASTQPKFNLLEVIYSPDQQELELMSAYNFIKKYIGSGKLNQPSLSRLPIRTNAHGADNTPEQSDDILESAHLDFFYGVINSLPNMFSLKNPAFKEELEWRLVSFLTKSTANDCLIRVSGKRLIPYREFTLEDLSMPIINEVIIGPCNDTPEFVIEKLLFQNGFKDVIINKSSSTYR